MVTRISGELKPTGSHCQHSLFFRKEGGGNGNQNIPAGRAALASIISAARRVLRMLLF